jgi:hypothetical protein
MDPTLAALLRSWTFDPWLIIPLSVAAGLYLRGWWLLHCQMPQRFGVWRLARVYGEPRFENLQL